MGKITRREKVGDRILFLEALVDDSIEQIPRSKFQSEGSHKNVLLSRLDHLS